MIDDATARLASAFTASGFPRMPASVIMALMVSENGALTAEQLAAELKASPAAISGAVRYLAQVGMVQRHRPHGERRYLYELPEHAWYSVSISKTPLYGVITALAGKAAEGLTGGASERMREMREFFAFLEKRLPLVLAEWEQYRQERQN